MSTLTAEQVEALQPLKALVAEWNAALDAVHPDCGCLPPGPQLAPARRCPGHPTRCVATAVIAIRTTMNGGRVRVANSHLSDRDLVRAIRRMGVLLDSGLSVGASSDDLSTGLEAAMGVPAARRVLRGSS